MIKTKALLVLGAVGFIAAAQAASVDIYKNSTTDLNTRFNPGTLEVGNQVVLAGTNRFLTTFSFEWWGTNTASASTFAGNIQADVRFYLNNGALYSGYAAPGTNFFDSGWFTPGTGTPTPRSTAILFADAGGGGDFPSGGLFIPANQITWTVQFRGMGATDTVGLDIYGPPSVGANFRDYWQYSAGSWSLQTNSLSTMGFGALMSATVPEPSTITLSIIGGLCMLTLARRLGRKE